MPGISYRATEPILRDGAPLYFMSDSAADGGRRIGKASIPGVILTARQRVIGSITSTMRERTVSVAAGVDDVMLAGGAAVAARVFPAFGPRPVEPVNVPAATGPVMGAGTPGEREGMIGLDDNA